MSEKQDKTLRYLSNMEARVDQIDREVSRLPKLQSKSMAAFEPQDQQNKLPDTDWSNSTVIPLKNGDSQKKTILLETCATIHQASFQALQKHDYFQYGELCFKEKATKAFITEFSDGIQVVIEMCGADPADIEPVLMLEDPDAMLDGLMRIQAQGVRMYTRGNSTVRRCRLKIQAKLNE